jgi:hypothetical protein
MNKKWLPHVITTGAFVVFIVLGLACASTPNKWEKVVYDGEDTPLLEGSTWTYIRLSNNDRRIAEFRSGGKMVISGWGDGTWQRRGNTVKFTSSSGWAHYEGTYYPETKKIMGSAENSDGAKWDWTMELIGGASVQNETALDGAGTGTERTSSSQSGVEAAMNNAAGIIMNSLQRNSKLAIVNVSSSDRDLSEFVAGELEYILVNNRFLVVDRSELDRIRREQNFQLSGDVDDGTIVSIGKFAGADVVITGAITGTGETRRLRLRALSTQTAQVMAVTSEHF